MAALRSACGGPARSSADTLNTLNTLNWRERPQCAHPRQPAARQQQLRDDERGPRGAEGGSSSCSRRELEAKPAAGIERARLRHTPHRYLGRLPV